MSRSAPQLPQTERGILYQLPLVFLASAVLVEAVFPGTSAAMAGWPLVISLFLIGMPHGAVDLSLNDHLSDVSRPAERLLSFAGYLALLAGSLLLFVTSPYLALILFVVLTAIHFGIADARGLDARFETASAPWVRTLSAASRGALIVALPFVWRPAEALAVFQNIISIAGYEPQTVAAESVATLAALVVCVALAAHGIVTISRVRVEQFTEAGAEALETAVVCLAFFTLHPLFAMGLYFLGWHSWRHLIVLMRLEPFRPARQSAFPWLSAVVGLHVRSLPLLAPTLLIFGGLAWWRIGEWSVDQLAALTVAFYVVVTLPHHLLIEQLCTKRPANEGERGDVAADLIAASHKTSKSLG